MLSELNMVGNWFKNEPDSGWKFDEIKFDDEAKSAFETLELDIRLWDYSARVNVRSNHTYIPSHYFLYALKLQPLVTLINKYIDVFDLLREVLAPEDIKNLINSTSPSNPITDVLDPYSKINFFDVFKDKNKRLKGKDIINGSGSDTYLRGNDDFVKSIILKALPVPDVSSDMLGQIIYSFSQSQSAFEILANKYSASLPYLFRDESGDELLFKIISTLGWQDKLELLFDGSSTETIGWGGITNAFLVKAPRVVGNTQYVEAPVHYSESLSKFVYMRKGLLDTESSLETVSNLISDIWPNMAIRHENSVYLFKSSERIDTLESVTGGATNNILYGPPGTGKTYHSIEAAVKAAEPSFTFESRKELKVEYERLVGKSRIRFVTFHQSYGYEEFVEGLRAQTNDNDQVSYSVEAGVFKSICEDAHKKIRENYVLIIDEINRGNISKIFGELITLIEPSKRKGRDEELDVTLPQSKELFSVPNNLHIIGTMNTADRSLAMMDTALRRRFDFVEMMPNTALFNGINVNGIDLERMLETMNKRIEVLYDRDHTLGHAFFMPVKVLVNDNEIDDAFTELKSVFKNKIIPLLEEYFFEDWNKIRLVLGDNQKDESLRFITENKQSYDDIFGSNHGLDSYETENTTYALAPFDGGDSVWDEGKAYIGIYSPSSVNSHSTGNE